jgi:hypothetical protein
MEVQAVLAADDHIGSLLLRLRPVVALVVVNDDDLARAEVAVDRTQLLAQPLQQQLLGLILHRAFGLRDQLVRGLLLERLELLDRDGVGLVPSESDLVQRLRVEVQLDAVVRVAVTAEDHVTILDRVTPAALRV